MTPIVAECRCPGCTTDAFSSGSHAGRLRFRLAEINRQIAEASGWGGLLTALDEERKGIEAELARIEGGAA